MIHQADKSKASTAIVKSYWIWQSIDINEKQKRKLPYSQFQFIFFFNFAGPVKQERILHWTHNGWAMNEQTKNYSKQKLMHVQN